MTATEKYLAMNNEFCKLRDAIYECDVDEADEDPQIQKTVEVEKENGIITGTILKSGTNGAVKFEFEYTDEEINAARYAQMMNYFIIGAGSNYYNYNWY